MSAEPWRRSGTPVAPRLFAWQAWYFGDLRVHLIGIQRNMTCVICLPGGYLHHLFGHGGIAFLDSTFPRRMFPPERDSCR